MKKVDPDTIGLVMTAMILIVMFVMFAFYDPFLLLLFFGICLFIALPYVIAYFWNTFIAKDE